MKKQEQLTADVEALLNSNAALCDMVARRKKRKAKAWLEKEGILREPKRLPKTRRQYKSLPGQLSLF